MCIEMNESRSVSHSARSGQRTNEWKRGVSDKGAEVFRELVQVARGLR